MKLAIDILKEEIGNRADIYQFLNAKKLEHKNNAIEESAFNFANAFDSMEAQQTFELMLVEIAKQIKKGLK